MRRNMIPPTIENLRAVNFDFRAFCEQNPYETGLNGNHITHQNLKIRRDATFHDWCLARMRLRIVY